MWRAFIILLGINFLVIILIPVIMKMVNLEAWSAGYTFYFITPVFLFSLTLLLGFVIYYFVDFIRKNKGKTQSNNEA